MPFEFVIHYRHNSPLINLRKSIANVLRSVCVQILSSIWRHTQDEMNIASNTRTVVKYQWIQRFRFNLLLLNYRERTNHAFLDIQLISNLDRYIYHIDFVLEKRIVYHNTMLPLCSYKMRVIPVIPCDRIEDSIQRVDSLYTL